MFSKKILLPFAAIALLLTGCSSDDIEKDAIPDLSQEALHAKAKQYASLGDYSNAVDYLAALDSRYPFGELTDQVQLDMIYVYYKSHKTDMARAAISRYNRLNPNSMYADYVLYMSGLTYLQAHGTMIQDFLGFDRAQKDPQNLYDAYKNFNDLIETYPESPYAKDAYYRLIGVKDQIARREWAIASFYQAKGALISAIRHYQTIVYSFPDTKYVKKALERMIENYEELGLNVPAQNARKVYENSKFDDNCL